MSQIKFISISVCSEDTLGTLFQWFCHHRMKVNEAKTQTIVLGTPAMLRGIPDVKMVFTGSEIIGSKEVKNLGIINRHLNYKAHADACLRSSNKESRRMTFDLKLLLN